MSRYDGLIIPRSYNEYINKTDPVAMSQALQLSGVLSGAVAAGDNKAVTSNAVNGALANYRQKTNVFIKNNSKTITITAYEHIVTAVSNHSDGFVIFINPWKEGYTLMSGTVPKYITITHDIYTYTVTIASSHPDSQFFVALV